MLMARSMISGFNRILPALTAEEKQEAAQQAEGDDVSRPKSFVFKTKAKAKSNQTNIGQFVEAVNAQNRR